MQVLRLRYAALRMTILGWVRRTVDDTFML
jgi:hypothetical protein